MRKLIILLVLYTAFFQRLQAQKFIPFPASFNGFQLFSVTDTTYSSDDSLFLVFGYYEDVMQENLKYYSLIIQGLGSDTSANGWFELVKPTGKKLTNRDSFWITYYNQLEELNLKIISGKYYISFYSNTLNYIYSVNDNADSARLDTIKQASEINDLAVCNDSVAFANVSNNGKNFIVKKNGGGWQLLPLLVAQPNPLQSLPDLLITVAVVLLVAGGVLYTNLVSKAREIKTLLKNLNPTANELKLNADKPLSYSQVTNQDTLSAIDAIVDVVKNRNTPLPMTIAINGAWGSGKSTIMNCIREKLDDDKEERYIATWFNAWHQQTESSLLDAFLLKVIDRYEKPFFKGKKTKAALAFIKFRLRLASARFIKWPFYTQILSGFALCFLVLSVIIIIINLYGLLDTEIFKRMGLLNVNLALFFKDNHFTSIIAVILPILSFFFLKSESKPTIGAFLNVMYKKTFLIEAEKNNPDVREKFRTQYWEIMEAVGDRVLVVFIDDLDRVNGDKIFDMLEALNFIGDVTSRPDDYENSSLKTVFVLGLYIDQVAEHLGIFLHKENAASHNDITKEEAIVLGRKYLEKMIQLNVPVPLTREEHIQ